MFAGPYLHHSLALLTRPRRSAGRSGPRAERPRPGRADPRSDGRRPGHFRSPQYQPRQSTKAPPKSSRMRKRTPSTSKPRSDVICGPASALEVGVFEPVDLGCVGDHIPDSRSGAGRRRREVYVANGFNVLAPWIWRISETTCSRRRFVRRGRPGCSVGVTSMSSPKQARLGAHRLPRRAQSVVIADSRASARAYDVPMRARRTPHCHRPASDCWRHDVGQEIRLERRGGDAHAPRRVGESAEVVVDHRLAGEADDATEGRYGL